MALSDITETMVAYAKDGSVSGFDLHAHVIWTEVDSLGGGKASKKAMPPLRGWVLGKKVHWFEGTLYKLWCYDGCSKRWLLMRLSDKKFYRFRE